MQIEIVEAGQTDLEIGADVAEAGERAKKRHLLADRAADLDGLLDRRGRFS